MKARITCPLGELQSAKGARELDTACTCTRTGQTCVRGYSSRFFSYTSLLPKCPCSLMSALEKCQFFTMWVKAQLNRVRCFSNESL